MVSAKDSLNDVLVDTVHDYAYLTNAGNKGSLVVLDLKTGKARQVLVGDRSTFADPNQHLMIGNEVAQRPDGSVVAIQADGIALSPDAQWLYYRPLTDHNYWRVPTAALRDARLSDAELSGKVEYLGNSVLSGGLIMGASGTLYGGDLEHRTVVALTLTPDHKLSSKVFVSDPTKLSWADGFAISGGYLYIADSHLWEVAFKNNLPRSGPLPDGTHTPDRSTRKYDPKKYFEGLILSDRSRRRFDIAAPVFGMDAVPERLHRHRTFVRIEAKNVVYSG